MPAFVNNKFGDVGIREADGTIVCCFSWKKSRKDCLISRDVMAEDIIPWTSRRKPDKTVFKALPKTQKSRPLRGGSYKTQKCFLSCDCEPIDLKSSFELPLWTCKTQKKLFLKTFLSYSCEPIKLDLLLRELKTFAKHLFLNLLKCEPMKLKTCQNSF